MGGKKKTENMNFNLVRLAKDADYFEDYTYKLITPNKMHVDVVIDNGGEKKETLFVFKKYDVLRRRNQ